MNSLLFYLKNINFAYKQCKKPLFITKYGKILAEAVQHRDFCTAFLLGGVLMGEEDKKVGVFEDDKCYFLFINDEVFSNFDEIIKKEFISICHGYRNSNKYKISSVAKEFLDRLKEKKPKDKIGYVGEFLYHIFSKYVFVGLTPISIFFNSEEKSAKKGFDMLLSDGECIWYSEVKSGMAEKDDEIDNLNAGRLSSAYSGLKAKVETENKNMVYWTTAIDKLCMCLKDEIDENMITGLLNNDLYCNNKKSKIIVSVIFHNSNIEIEKKRIKKLINK